MKFDLAEGQYNVVKADDIQKIIMETYGYDTLYLFRHPDGSELSVTFHPKEMESFCPSRTVSEMMKSWADGITERRKLFEKSVAENVHPYWTSSHKIMASHLATKKTYIVSHEIHEFPQTMSKESKETFLREIAKLKVKEGAVICDKIVL